MPNTVQRMPTMTHNIINQDCREYLKGPFTPRFDFIIADPPFNINLNYQGYSDNLTDTEYREFTKEWVLCCWNKLKPGAAFFIHGSPQCSREILRALFALQLDRYIETEICLGQSFGQHTYNNFIQTHCRAIVLRMPGENRKWYVQNVLTPSKRFKMGDKRIATSEHKGMVPFGNVWGFDVFDESQVVKEPIESLPNWGRVQGNNSERRKFSPCQLPEKYVSRPILAYTQENDLVYDPFAGSGTTLICCKRLNRYCISTEVSQCTTTNIHDHLSRL